MMDAIDELITHRRQTGSISPMLRRVHKFHRTNPQVLDFLVSEMYVDKENGWTRTSLGSLWHYARWVLTRKHRAPGESFVMSNNLSRTTNASSRFCTRILTASLRWREAKQTRSLAPCLSRVKRPGKGIFAGWFGRTAQQLRAGGGPQHRTSRRQSDAGASGAGGIILCAD